MKTSEILIHEIQKEISLLKIERIPPGFKDTIENLVAKTYFVKQFDNSLAEEKKDMLFKNFMANYKFNPITHYDTLVFEH